MRIRKEKISEETALEELVADSMEAILKSGRVVETMAKIKKADAKAHTQLKGWFKKLRRFLRRMVNVYGDQSANTEEGLMVSEFAEDLLQQIEQIFAEGAVEAGRNYRAAKEQDAEVNENTTDEGGVRMMVRVNVVDVNGKIYNKVVKPGLTVYQSVKHSKKDYVSHLHKRIFKRKTAALDGNGEKISIEFAKPDETVQKDGAKNPHPVLGKLEEATDRLEKVAIINIKDLINNSKPLAPSSENSHGWMDEGGWRDRIAYMADFDVIYPVILHIPKTRDGRHLLYAVSVLKKEGTRIDIDATALAAQSARAPDSNANGTQSAVEILEPSNEKISQPSKKVKQNSDSAKMSDRDEAPTFYSQMGKVVEGVKQEKLGAASVVSMLRGKGVKAEEIKWSGIEEWLAGKKSVTKAELQEFIEGSMLQLEEHAPDNNKKAKRQLDSLLKKYIGDYSPSLVNTYLNDPSLLKQELEWMEETGKKMPPKEVQARMVALAESNTVGRWKAYKLPNGNNYREITFSLPGATYSNDAMKNHWGYDAQGILAHARVQDFKVNGKKLLFVEEIQSDWHNQGSKEGYVAVGQKRASEIRKDSANAYAEFAESDVISALVSKLSRAGVRNADAYMERVFDGDQSAFDYISDHVDLTDAEMNAIEQAASQQMQRVDEAYTAPSDEAAPDAPFKDTYHEFVMKRLIREAAEKGYDSIGWTTADIQNKRWSDDFAEGYRIEYDQDIPKFMRKYGKKWGADVSRTKLRFGPEIWAMDITDTMRKSVMTEGQPLFQDRDYSYAALVQKPDMTVTTLDDTVPSRRADVIAQAKNNAAELGHKNPQTGSISVYVADVDTDVILGRDGLKHSLDRRFNLNAPIVLKAGEILSNSIRINELVPEKEDAAESYVLVGAAKNKAGEVYVVRSVVNRFSNELVEMDVLYAINAKKEPAALLPLFTDKPALGTDSTITIAKLLEYVNQYFPDILPEDVLKHFGHDARPAGELGEDALYQDRDTDSFSNRALLANALESTVTDELEKKKLQEYREQIGHFEAEERKLQELNRQIKELSFAKGPRDQAKIRALREEAAKTVNRINTYDERLLRLEAAAPLKKVLEREKKKAFDKAANKGRAALKEVRNRRDIGVLKKKIRKDVMELTKLYRKGRDPANVKEGMRDVAEYALAAAEVLFTDTYTDEDMIRNGVEVALTEDVSRLFNEAKDLMAELENATAEEESALKRRLSKIKKELAPVFKAERQRLDGETVT